MTEPPAILDHTGVRDVTITDGSVTVSIMCLYDGWVTSHTDYIAEQASDACAADWNQHAPDVDL